MGIAEGEEWEPLAGSATMPRPALAGVRRRARRIAAPAAERGRGAGRRARPTAASRRATSNRPRRRSAASCSTSPSRRRCRSPTASSPPRPTSPSRPTSARWVNQRGLFRRSELADVFRAAKIPSAQKWARPRRRPAHRARHRREQPVPDARRARASPAPLFGTRLFPIGTVYDPFIARGLDALNYGCYQDARFLLVATPSGVTLGPEGGAHQSINSPLIGIGQPGLTYYEPAFADELALMMR